MICKHKIFISFPLERKDHSCQFFRSVIHMHETYVSAGSGHKLQTPNT